MKEIRYTFNKSERLCLAKDIDHLFENGRWLRSEHFRFIYFEIVESQEEPVKVLFTAPKKLHKTSVKRNLLKRRMREAYRLNKLNLISTLDALKIQIQIAFVYSVSEVAEYKIIETEIKKLLAQLISRISKSREDK